MLRERESGLRVVGALNNKKKTGVCICFRAMQSDINEQETIVHQMEHRQSLRLILVVHGIVQSPYHILE